MNKKQDSPLHMSLVILIVVSVIIIRDGLLLDSRLYFTLLGTLPLAFLVAYGIWKDRRNADFSRI